MGSVADDDRYFNGLEALSRYSGLTVKTLRRYINDPTHPLPCHHVATEGKRGRLLTSKRAFDAWVAGFPAPLGKRAAKRPVAEDVAEVVRSMKGL